MCDYVNARRLGTAGKVRYVRRLEYGQNGQKQEFESCNRDNAILEQVTLTRDPRRQDVAF
jgi:hypothetical protein